MPSYRAGRVNSSAKTLQNLSDCAKSLTEPAVILAEFFNESSTLSVVACKRWEVNGPDRTSWPDGLRLRMPETSETVRVAWLRVKTSFGAAWQLTSAPPHAASEGRSVLRIAARGKENALRTATFAEKKAKQIA